MKIIWLAGILFILNLFSLHGQKLEYEIFIKDKQIGSLIAEYFKDADTSKFIIYTNAEISFLFSFELQHVIKTKFINGDLYYSFTRNEVNHKEKERTETKTIGRVTEFYTDDKMVNEITEPISYSVAQLYHIIPENVSKVYSERFGKFLSLVEKTDRVYELTLPDGKKNLYIYGLNNVCKKVVAEQTFADLVILLKQKF